MSAVRFIIEGEWSGYQSSQQRVVHRTVHVAALSKRLRAWADKTHAIRYTDGTALFISVRDCKPRERVAENHGYTSLIADCSYYDVDSVQALIDAKARAKEGSSA